MFCKYWPIVLFLICIVVADKSDDVEEKSELSRDNRGLDEEEWTMVESKDWAPKQQTPDDRPADIPKRRRVRKRKRKPPILPLGPANIKAKSPGLDEGLQPWEEVDLEEIRKPNQRRRITPVFQPDSSKEERMIFLEEPQKLISATTRAEVEGKVGKKQRIRDPFTALQEAEEKQKKSPSVAPDLKALLKQSSGTLSLSEILQQKNLSLSELLMGNRQAISALAEKQSEISETEGTEIPMMESTTYRRIPVQSISRNMDKVDSVEALTVEETRETQRRRLQGQSKIYAGVSKFDVIMEPTTEKRVFVPFAPANSVEIPKTDNSNATIEPVEIIREDSLITKDEPLKMTIDLNRIVQTPNKAVTSKTDQHKTKTTSAKQEIMDVLSDPSMKKRLSRILADRNMTIDELVQQRERGSSQLHLADIFHNKKMEPEPAEEPYIGQMYPIFGRRQKSFQFPQVDIKLPKSNTQLPQANAKLPHAETRTTPSAMVVQLDVATPKPKIPSDMELVTKEEKVSVHVYKTEPNTTDDFPPAWRELYPDLFPKDDQSIVASEELQRLEEIENKLAEVANSRLNIDVSKHSYNVEEGGFMSLPTGVKSAIIASFAIIGASLLVFLTILVVFRWSQKKKARLCYASSISGSKIKSPILEVPPARSLRTFVCETLGKRRNYYKTHIQSMSDSIWDGNKQSF